MIAQCASIELRRSAWVEIDLEALAHNVYQLRNLVGRTVIFYAVCKGDAYGVGIERSPEQLWLPAPTHWRLAIQRTCHEFVAPE